MKIEGIYDEQNNAKSFFIELPLKSFNQNKTTMLSRGNKFEANRSKSDAQNIIIWQLRKQKVKKIKTPCKILAVWNVPNENRDMDNLMLKNVLDALQIERLLENDNLKHIKGICNEYVVNKNRNGVELVFIDFEE